MSIRMASHRYDVLGIGNAIVDIISRAEEDFIIRQGMRKGTMALIEEPRAEAIYDAMGPAVEISGGSAANTIVGVAGFGARAAFVGKVRDDSSAAPSRTTFALRAWRSTRRPRPMAPRPRAATFW
jgi:sugar/nucleoside kinase (ribokinase family)